MPRLTVPQLLLRLEHTFIIRAAAIIFGFGMLIISLTLIVWATFFQSQTKIISGINYYNYPVRVKFGDTVTEVNTFEGYNFTTSEFGKLKVEVSDTTGKVLTTRVHDFSRSAAIAIDILSENDAAKLCYAQGNVTNIFYATSTETPPVTEIKILTDKGSNSYMLEVAALSNTTLYPGNFAGTLLPEELDRQQKVWGVYPVDCNDVTDKGMIANDIINLTDADPSTQRNLYAEKVKEIIDSPEYNH